MAWYQSVPYVQVFFIVISSLSLIPLACTVLFILNWFYSRRKFSVMLAQHLSARRRGYGLLGDDDGEDREEGFGDRLINPEHYRVRK